MSFQLTCIFSKSEYLKNLSNFSGGIENHRSSVIGLFRRESIGSEHYSSNDSTPKKERRESSGTHNNSTTLVDDGNPDPLGVMQKTMSTNTIPPLPQPPQTPGQRRQNRRGSMLELSGCVDTVYRAEIRIWKGSDQQDASSLTVVLVEKLWRSQESVVLYQAV